MSLMRNSLTIGLAAFVAYCVYFDRKRRNAPDFKAKLKEKRLKAKRSKENSLESDIPLFTDPSELQPYFLKEVQASDDLLMNGDYEKAAFHLANATVVCSQKNEFLAVMQKTLPDPVFQLLLQYYQVANERYLKKVMTNELLKQMSQPKQSTISMIGSKGQQFDDTDIE
ncbi:mitochondrial import receptor subunit TOM20 homolog B [Dermatophagoides farinae]|uniref:mitochondrial import receptor subunit TOM20 n=1 Tax=Dermatophagoides farinae TaxID=6954 RepID=A0A922IE46_DERFA|nr:mitochondrial import receptor subunit TOM20 homolog B-like [Dermatophagoides farinae]KAH7642064.1 mitochondrial import receptor subunit tom20 [Dermatophagoides farinae]KAH9529198.1 Mitochondrial import receptor subunit TOM20 [Dermatophagoides farinae]